MFQKQLPADYIFNPEYLVHYKPGMERNLPETAVEDGKMVVADKKHLLSDFLTYYFRLVQDRGEIIHQAHMELAMRELSDIVTPDENLRAELEGSIDLLRAFRDQVVKTRNYTIQKGWAEGRWPINALQDVIKELNEYLERIKTSVEPEIVKL